MTTNPITFDWIPDWKKHQNEQGSVNNLGSLPNGSLRKFSPIQKKQLIGSISKVERVISLVSSLEKPFEKN